MKKRRLPKTDSSKKLVHLWDTQELTEFEVKLQEIAETVFVQRTTIPLNLESGEAKAVRKIAKTKGVADAELIRRWVREKIRAS